MCVCMIGECEEAEENTVEEVYIRHTQTNLSS